MDEVSESCWEDKTDKREDSRANDAEKVGNWSNNERNSWNFKIYKKVNPFQKNGRKRKGGLDAKKGEVTVQMMVWSFGIEKKKEKKKQAKDGISRNGNAMEGEGRNANDESTN